MAWTAERMLRECNEAPPHSIFHSNISQGELKFVLFVHA